MTDANDSKFLTRKWNIVNDKTNLNSGVGNEIKYNTEVLKSNLCDCNNAYILVRADITVVAASETQVAFKNCAPFTKCFTMIDGTAIDDVEDLDVVMPMYNLIEYSSNYSKTTASFWFYSKDPTTNFNAYITNTDIPKVLGNTVADGANGMLRNPMQSRVKT